SLDPRSHRISQDRRGRGHDVRCAVERRSEAAARAASPDSKDVKKIALPQEGLETLYGAHDGNLKHIESLLGVQIRTHGDELIVEGERAAEQRVERIVDQLVGRIAEGYELKNGDVKTAAQLVASDENVDLRHYFLREGQKQPEGTKRSVNPRTR